MSVTCVAPNGQSFSNNWWWWRPLAAYCFETCPAILEPSDHFCRWSTNDGSATEAEAHALGRQLQIEIDSGRTLAYMRKRERRIAAMPDEACPHCCGTGTRYHTPLTADTINMWRAVDPVLVGDSFTCNGCNGHGKRRPADELYFFSIENVAAFARFCRDSDGFKVM